MHAVADQPGAEFPAFERGADKAGLAMAERAHRVEQMRDQTGACLGIGYRGPVTAVAVSKADMDAGFCQPRHLRAGNAFGGAGDDQRGQFRSRGDQRLEIGVVHRPDQVDGMRALAAGRQMRPFQMDAGEARNFRPGRLDARLDRIARHVARVGDQRRQYRGGAEPHVRGTDRADRLDARPVIEQDAAAAIDLQVDEARYEHRAGAFRQHCPGRHVVAPDDPFHLAVVDHECGMVVPACAVENASPGDCVALRHTVSVTLRRRAGASGLRPLRRDSASRNR